MAAQLALQRTQSNMNTSVTSAITTQAETNVTPIHVMQPLTQVSIKFWYFLHYIITYFKICFVINLFFSLSSIPYFIRKSIFYKQIQRQMAFQLSMLCQLINRTQQKKLQSLFQLLYQHLHRPHHHQVVQIPSN